MRVGCDSSVMLARPSGPARLWISPAGQATDTSRAMCVRCNLLYETCARLRAGQNAAHTSTTAWLEWKCN
eukprot:10683915-Alexandrium_andersonii.AAC.1